MEWFPQHGVGEEVEAIHKVYNSMGAYQYKVCPVGWLASSDAYSKRYDDILRGTKDFVKCIDDVCQWDETLEGSFLESMQAFGTLLQQWDHFQP